jgi:hypothetical protein
MLFNVIDESIYDQLNKLFCTFTEKDLLDDTVSKINSMYSVIYSKIFVLEISDSNEYVCTYNIESENTDKSRILPGTILMHRRKETDTLYTINSLNLLIASLNNGVVDKTYRINWPDYRNSILLTRAGKFTKLNTKIHKIIVTS